MNRDPAALAKDPGSWRPAPVSAPAAAAATAPAVADGARLLGLLCGDPRSRALVAAQRGAVRALARLVRRTRR
jgi:hypothetical protein